MVQSAITWWHTRASDRTMAAAVAVCAVLRRSASAALDRGGIAAGIAGAGVAAVTTTAAAAPTAAAVPTVVAAAGSALKCAATMHCRRASTRRSLQALSGWRLALTSSTSPVVIPVWARNSPTASCARSVSSASARRSRASAERNVCEYEKPSTKSLLPHPAPNGPLELSAAALAPQSLPPESTISSGQARWAAAPPALPRVRLNSGTNP